MYAKTSYKKYFRETTPARVNLRWPPLPPLEEVEGNPRVPLDLAEPPPPPPPSELRRFMALFPSLPINTS